MCLCNCCAPPNDDNNIFIVTDFVCTCWCSPVKYSDFHPEDTGFRTSREEFRELINLIRKECNYFIDIQIAKLTYVLNFVIFEIFVILWGNTLPSGVDIGMFIFCCIFAYVFHVVFISLRMRKHEMKIREVLRIENILKYAQRGLYWEIGPSCNFLHLKLNYGNNVPLLNEENMQIQMPGLIQHMDLNMGLIENSISKYISKFSYILSLIALLSLVVTLIQIIIIHRT